MWAVVQLRHPDVDSGYLARPAVEC
ncbi:hypothetical protein SEA_SCHOTTB_68 [Gordonia Phage SchottB]|nr:hypothetical protein SEA_SCHOTTB_68 [Gordonia Phage SchottB]